MIVQKVIVNEVIGKSLVLDPVSSGCSSCQSGGCGAASLAGLFGNKSRNLKISDPGGFIPGEEADLLMEESFFLKTVALQYLLPLIMILVAVIFASMLSGGFLPQALSALSGLIGGVALSRYTISRITSSSDGVFRIRKTSNTNDGKEFSVQVMVS